jgi:2'-5' RNA ligase
MSEPGAEKPTRDFVAVDPAPEVAAGLEEWGREALAPLEGVRPLPAESLHLTLSFLGNLDLAEVEAARAIVAAVEPRPVRLRLGPRLVGVPRRRPRILALPEAGGELAGLQGEIEAELVSGALLEPPGRPFWPHLSVARVRRGTLDGRRGKTAIASLPPPPRSAIEGFDAVRVALYRSELRPDGASYSPMADVYLPRSGE